MKSTQAEEGKAGMVRGLSYKVNAKKQWTCEI